MDKKYQKYEPYTLEWEQAANALARTFAPLIYACRTCGYPVIKGYCCTNCKSSNPSESNND